MKDLHELPKFRDKLSYLYIEHARIDRHENAIAFHDIEGMTPVPVAGLAVLMMGPGTSVTHAAVRILAVNNCLAIWCGEENVRFYAAGMGGTRGAARLLKQAQLAAVDETRLAVAKRMYTMRFDELIPEGTTIETLRGMEGARVRRAYAEASEASGVPWHGRSYDRGDWRAADPVNRALSAANSCLYGICHAALLSAGYSPAIGFIHTGKQLSFVYDVADLYKTEISIPVAFAVIADGHEDEVERTARMACRDAFRRARLLKRIITDITALMGDTNGDDLCVYDDDEALPADLWTPSSEEPDTVM